MSHVKCVVFSFSRAPRCEPDKFGLHAVREMIPRYTVKMFSYDLSGTLIFKTEKFRLKTPILQKVIIRCIFCA